MKRFLVSFTITLLLLFVMIGVFVYIEDPFYHYHGPLFNEEAYMDNAVYQTPGAAKHFTYDAVIVGSSMTENFRSSWFEEMDLKLLKLSYAGAKFRDYKTIIDKVFESGNQVKLVMTDINEFQLLSEVEAVYEEYPSYLYDDRIINDTGYIFNDDVFWESADRALEAGFYHDLKLDDSYTWEEAELFSEENARKDYDTFVEQLKLSCEDGSYTRSTREEMLEKCRQNMDYLIYTIKEHPDTRFVFYYPPYSVLFWEEAVAEDNCEDVLELYRVSMERLLTCDNVLIFNFQDDEELVTDLSRYRDVCHHDPQGNRFIYECVRDTINGSGKYCDAYIVNHENIDEHLDNVRRILEDYQSEAEQLEN
ncbi:MAG: hypothetical protein K6G69_02810 [Lachnospiraceae bacterium]|nr:hypothetical protein [Lachnospiraceae bacterium]